VRYRPFIDDEVVGRIVGDRGYDQKDQTREPEA